MGRLQNVDTKQPRQGFELLFVVVVWGVVSYVGGAGGESGQIAKENFCDRVFS